MKKRSVELESEHTMQQDTFRPRKDPRLGMEQALDKAIEVSVGRKQYTITDGRLVYEQHRRYRYAFTLESSWDFPDGTDFQLRSSDFDRLPVELSNTKDVVIVIITTQRLPERTRARAFLVIEHAHLLRKMKEALIQMGRTGDLGLKLYGHRDSPDESAASSLVDVMSDVFVPDDAQRLAIQRSLASEVQMILGPGGTGKTDVLAAIAMVHAMLYKHRVLITSHTNIAIDNAVIRLAAFFRKHDMEYFLDEQNLVRAGNPHLAVLETDTYRNITMSLIVNEYGEQQREEIAQLERRRTKLLHLIGDAEDELPRQIRAWQRRKETIPLERERAEADLDRLEEEEQRRLAPIMAQLTPLLKRDSKAKVTMEQAETNRLADEALLAPLQHDYARQWTPYEDEQEKLERLRKHQPVARFFVQVFTGEWVKTLETSVETLAEPLRTLHKQISPIRERLVATKQTSLQAEQLREHLKPSLASWTRKREGRPASSLHKKAQLTLELEKLKRELQTGNPRILELEHTLVKARQERNLIEDTLAHLDQQVEDAKREAARKGMESAQIVGATLTSLYLNPTLLNQQWDVVIIDEGSMAPPPAVMIAAQCARTHVIVVGDPLQLAPVCKFKDPLVKLWLGRDVFHHGGYTLQQAGTGTHHSVLLPYQSRMHTDICDLVRGLIYKNLLKDRDPHRPRPKFGPEPEHAVVLYDTGDVPEARACKPKSGFSRYNSCHAEIAIKLALLALADFPEEERTPECIGIVTPYAEQRERIKELVRGTALETYARIGTVHAFQGLEFDVLIFDTVESPGLEIAPFLRGGWGSDAMRLLNVAVSRARHKLFIIANMPHIQQEPAPSILSQMMELACQKKCVSAVDLEPRDAQN